MEDLGDVERCAATIIAPFLHVITFDHFYSFCVQPFLAWSDNIKITSLAQLFLFLEHHKTNAIKHDSCILMLMEICIGCVGGVAQVVRRLTDTRLMSRGQELWQRINQIRHHMIQNSLIFFLSTLRLLQEYQ